MSHAIPALCGTLTACAITPVGLSFAAKPPSPTIAPKDAASASIDNDVKTPSPAGDPHSMLDTVPSTPSRSPARFLSRRISSFHEAWPSSRSSSASHASRPRFSRRSISNFSDPSHTSDRDAPSRSNAYSSSSAQPFVAPGLVTPPSAPNKLVKRSLSQREPKKTPPSSFRLHLKLPATSHQRSASRSMHSIEAARAQDLRPVEAYTDPKSFPARAQNFFHIRHTKIRASHDSDPVHIKQLRPSDSDTPVLVQAGAVSPPELVLVHELLDNDLHKSPRVLSSPVTSSRPYTDELQTTTTPPPTKRATRDNDISARKKASNNTTPQARLLRRISRRITSAPSLRSRSAAMDDENSNRAQQQQQQHQHFQRAPSGPFTFGESESDASPPATPTFLPSRILQRRTRPSATSSDQASSRPGSEGGTRVFSWAEGFDDDMNSDTIYDSIRTTATRSTSGKPQPGLETLFDQSSSGMAAKDSGIEARRSVSHDQPATHANAQPGSPLNNRPQTPVQRKLSVRLRAPSDQAGESRDFDAGELDGDAPQTQTSTSGNGPGLSPRDTGVKSSLFDWSEQPAVGGAEGGTPPRPKTAHPKKQLEVRGAALSTGRRAPSGLHSRSHSVPALQDLAGRQHEPGSKFGSWGVGAKGATESWDNDFEFEDLDLDDARLPMPEGSGQGGSGASRHVSGSMIVPASIQKQQSNVLANISLLREWGILIEELKEMRMRANHVGVRVSDNARLFDEVDAMIDLADQEAEDDGFPLGIRSPASSQTFSDDDGFDQITPPRPDSVQRTRLSPTDMLRVMQRNKPARASPRVDSPEAFQRPRQDSEAMARSVIEALQRWRKPADADGGESTPQGKTKKVPFDTATLKHIVPHVNNLMHQVKRIVREAEGLNTSPLLGRSVEDLALKQAFRTQPTLGEESPGAQKEQRLRLHGRRAGTTNRRATPTASSTKTTTTKMTEGDVFEDEEDDEELEAELGQMQLG